MAMLKTRNVRLPSACRSGLKAYQATVNAWPTFAEQVTQGKRHYKNRNKEDDPVFADIRRVLRRMAPGPNRCVYCEDSSAHQIDHFCPQDFYPGQIFKWENYLWSCGLCNHAKGASFCVIRPGTTQIDEVRRNRNAPPIPPPPGEPAFINPRHEDPLDWFQLDLINTFHLRPRAPVGTLDYERADRTIRVLGLNERDDLVAQRRNAAGNYEARLRLYIIRRDSQATARQLTLIRNALLRLDHPTVWLELQRQYDRVARIRHLFVAAPEALDW
jgi:uncharacterized protein (TIGR02646 family)